MSVEVVGDSPTPTPATTTTGMRPVTVRTLVVAGILILTALAVTLMLRMVADTILLLLVAIVFAEGIRPLVVRVERLRVPKVAAILVVYVFLLAVLAGIVVVLVAPVVGEVQALIASFPRYQHDISNAFKQAESSLHLSADLGTQVAGSLNTAKDILLTVGGYMLSAVVDFVIVLLLGFLWLTSSDRLKAFVVDLFHPRQQHLAADVISEMGSRMGGYLQATAFNMVVVGVATGLAAWGLGLPGPLLLGILAGTASAVPLIGPFVGAVPTVLLGFTIGPFYPLIVALVIVVIQLIDANFVLPQVMNRVVSLPALAVVLALLMGGAVAGIIGALVAIPLAAAAHVLIVSVVVPAIHHTQGRNGQVTSA